MNRYNQPLTLEQQRFAEENHNIVHSFIRFKRLNGDYYDVVVFGYIRAVRNYFEREDLRQYAFRTIAYHAMNSDLYNHYRKQNRQKRKANVLSLDASVSEDGSLTLTDIVSGGADAADEAVHGMLLDDIFGFLPQEQLNIVRMKAKGYKGREIAKEYGMPVKSVEEILLSVKALVYSGIF